MSALEELAASTPQYSPTACKLAAAGHLDKLLCSMHGFDEMTIKEATVTIGTQFYIERERIKEAMEAVQDCVTGLGEGTVKVAAHAWHPPAIMPEAWNFMRVEKVALLLEVAELAEQAGEYKLASLALDKHDHLAVTAFDYFKDYSSKIASDLQDKTAAAGVLGKKVMDLGEAIYQDPAVRKYGETAIKGVVGGAGLAAGAAPIINYTADKTIDNARDKALQTALGTAGIAVGANQLNNVLSNFSKQGSAEDTLHPFGKVAMHFLLDETLSDAKHLKNNKIAAVHALYEFCKEETPMFDKEANMFAASNSDSLQGMSAKAVQTPQYPMGSGGTPMAGDSASAIGNAASGGSGGSGGSK